MSPPSFLHSGGFPSSFRIDGPGMLDSDFSDSQTLDDEGLEYRAIDPLAVIALVLGIFSPLVLTAALLCLVPIVGLVVALIAIRRTSGSEPRRGRWLAIAGMALSTFFLAMPMAQQVSSQWLAARQARYTADAFWQFLREESPQKACMLKAEPDYRPPFDERLWETIRYDQGSKMRLEELVKKPEVRMILALGEKADIQFHEVRNTVLGYELAYVDLQYTVTFVDPGDEKRKTMLLGILLERKGAPLNPDLNPWFVKDVSTITIPNAVF